MRNLAIEFGVSVRTIRYDIEMLSLTFPLVTSKGHAGGVAVMDGYRYGDNYLSEKQRALLVRVLEMLSGEDRAVIQSILDEFAPREQVG